MWAMWILILYSPARTVRFGEGFHIPIWPDYNQLYLRPAAITIGNE